MFMATCLCSTLTILENKMYLPTEHLRVLHTNKQKKEKKLALQFSY